MDQLKNQLTTKANLVTEPEEIRKLYEFIKACPLDYPDYLAWVDKCFKELERGYKKAFAYKINDNIVGNIIFQKHKENPHVLEIKNCRVEPEYRRQHIFTELYNLVERYAKDYGFKKIICDTHSDNTTFIRTMEGMGFKRKREETLYSQRLETILAKDLE